MEQSPSNWAGQNAQTSPLTAMWRLPKTFLNLERAQRIPWTAKDKAVKSLCQAQKCFVPHLGHQDHGRCLASVLWTDITC